MDSANRTRRVYEAKTLFLGEAGEEERRGLLILKPVFLRNFGCYWWRLIATKHFMKKWRSRQLSPPKISLSSSSLYSEFFDVGKASFKCGTAVGGDCCPTRRLESQMYHHCVAVIWVADFWLMKYMQLLFYCCIQHLDKIQIVCCMNSAVFLQLPMIVTKRLYANLYTI